MIIVQRRGIRCYKSMKGGFDLVRNLSSGSRPELEFEGKTSEKKSEGRFQAEGTAREKFPSLSLNVAALYF